jgi:pyruvate formate-lyase activating enzyme-like uncharacterized protein
MDRIRAETVEANEREFGQREVPLKWVSPEQAEAALRERSELLDYLYGKALFGFCGTKVDCRDLSPGCVLCGSGVWSCLFVNGICNARCFYCPAEQRSKSKPMTAGIEFENPREYVEYVERLGIKGVGLSGGEPFLTMERTLAFASALKRRFGDALYLWLYTNGMAATEEGLKRLADAGLDEIRFDLTAVGYDTSRLSLASRIIKRVTVEIPAIPEDYPRLERLVLELPDAGVRHLNLHQLRVTSYNSNRLMERGYTFLHGEQVTVLESELTALKVLAYAKKAGTGLPINYCSFAFRGRFQAMGQRKRCARLLCRPYEDITGAGYIRRLHIRGEALQETRKTLERIEARGLWMEEPSGKGIILKAELIGKCRGVLPTHASYYLATLLPSVSYRHPFEKVPLGRKRSIYAERQTVLDERRLEPSEASKLLELIDSGRECYMDESEQELFPYECLPAGLQGYF